LNYFFIILLTALEIAQGETHRWRAGSANKLECRKSAYRSKICASRFIYEPLPKMLFLTVPMTRNSTNPYQIRWLWSTKNHLARAG